MLRNALLLELLAHHEACDVLQEDQRDFTLTAHLDEVGSLLSAFGEQHSVVCHDTHLVPIQVTKASDERATKSLFELVEATAV